LPAPHPLDYDWRFTPSTSDFLYRESARIAAARDALVCLGTPTVFEEALRNGEARRSVLVDANPAVVSHFLQKARWIRACKCDLLTDSVPAIKSSVIVADPPWYLDYMAAFLWASSQICTRGAHLLMSLPPLGTRPGVAKEIDEFLGMVRAMGFDLVHSVEGALKYESPPFERNALRAAGVRLNSYDWRCGDLHVFRFCHATRQLRPGPSRSRRSWDDESLHGMRVRLRNNATTEFADPTLRSLVTGDVLPSVSSRDPLRSSVDVWTGGNRVFRCAGTNTLRQVIRAIARGQNPALRVASSLDRGLSAQERQLICKSAEQVAALAQRERSDFCFAGLG
jgi:hypothetical protein